MSRNKHPALLKTKNFGLIIGGLFSVLFSLTGMYSGLYSNLESRLLDSYFSFKNVSDKTAVQKGAWHSNQDDTVSPDILIVGIDLKALQKFGTWPFPRSVHASFIDSFSRIQKQDEREKALFLDIFFIDDSGQPEADMELARSITESGNVYLESILDSSSFGESIDQEMIDRQHVLFSKTGNFGSIVGDWKKMKSYYGLQTNQEAFNSGVKGYGAANIEPDYTDESVRRQPMVLKYSRFLGELSVEDLTPGHLVDESSFQRMCWFDNKGREHQIDLPLTESSLLRLSERMYKEAPPLVYDADGDGNFTDETRVVEIYQDYFLPSIPLSLALDYWNSSVSDCTVVPGKEIRVARKGLTDIVIPVDEQCQMLINYAGKASSTAADGNRTFPVRSYAGYYRDSSADQADWPQTRAVGGKIVMVGAFDKGMADDEKQTPYGMMFGIEIHANSLNTLLTGNFIRTPPEWVNFLLVVSAIMLIALVSSRLKNMWSLPISLIILVGLFLTCSILFDRYSVLINYSVLFSGMIFTYITIVLYRASTEEREKRKIRAMFGKYVSPEVVAQMEDNPPELGGVDRELTVFFSDIRGFTSLSETLPPQELVKHLNEYLSAMTDIILETGGTLDKYVGDEIMCFWGAPLEVKDHAYKACVCALLQKEKLNELNQNWPEEKRLSIGIGINTGIMTVGNMGSKGRMNYTLMGDNVNLGARLEGTNKIYGTMIIVSESTYALTKDQFVFRELDTIRVKGKNRPVVIYELLDRIS